MSLLNIENSYLSSAYNDFNDKLKDIDDYLELINTLDNTKGALLSGQDSITSEPVSLLIERNLKKTLRSSAFLLLYNLIESTMTAAIDAIYANLQFLEVEHQAKNSDYFIFKLKDSIRKHLLKQYSSIFSVDGIKTISLNKTGVFSTIIDKGYDKKQLFNGNIDFSVIKDEAKRFGFNIKPLSPPHGLFDTDDILNIKNKRNRLAHGAETFSECGQNIAIGEMKKKFISTVNMLNAVFIAIDKYLNDQEYLEPV